MRRTALMGFTALVGTISFIASASGQTEGEAAPIYGVRLPAGYRDWPLISVATVGAPVSDMRAKLGNDVAMKAFRAGTLPFPDGTIIARLAWKQITSEENNRALGPAAEKQLGAEAAQKLLSQSFVAGPAINVQFMVKDSKKYASTGGWGLRSSMTASRPTRRCTRPVLRVTVLPKTVISSLPAIPTDSDMGAASAAFVSSVVFMVIWRQPGARPGTVGS